MGNIIVKDKKQRFCKNVMMYSLFQTFAVFCMLYVLFWVILRRLNFICRRFGTLYLFHLHLYIYLPMKMEQTECSETSAYKIQTPGNYPEEKHTTGGYVFLNPLNAELNPICYLLPLLRAHHFLLVSRIRVKDTNAEFTLKT